MTERADKPKASKPKSKPPPRRRRRAKRRGKTLPRVLAAMSVVVAVSAGALLWWSSRGGPSRGQLVAIEWPQAVSAPYGARLLADQGLTTSPTLMALFLWASSPFVELEAGPHLLPDGATPWEIMRRLARLGSRERVRVTIPEGYNLFQVAERIEQRAVCSRAVFMAVARERQHLEALGVRGASAEGYLFPATYDLYADSRAADVLSIMVRETKRRFVAIAAKHGAALRHLEEHYGWSEHEVLTLASIIEKEAASPEEQPLVASVFFNRLEDSEFRPLKMLQSDPTAAYGCLLDPGLGSCAGYAGRVLPPMLRDGSNPYNTYKHPGLPPGPIASPGERAIEAVLAPAKTDFLFFFASGNGGHTFSRSLAEHEAVIAPARNKARANDSFGSR